MHFLFPARRLRPPHCRPDEKKQRLKRYIPDRVLTHEVEATSAIAV